MNIFCAICFELFSSKEAATIPCGHVFHSACLSQWFRCARSCPECRQETTQSIQNIYFNAKLDGSIVDDLNVVQSRLIEMLLQIISAKNDLRVAQSRVEKSQQLNISLMKKVLMKQISQNVLIKRCEKYCEQAVEAVQLRLKLNQYERKIRLITKVKRLLTSSACEVDVIMRGRISDHDLALFVSVLKRELGSSQDALNSETSALKESKRQVIQLKAGCNKYKALLDKSRDVEKKLLKCQTEKDSLLEYIKELEKKAIELSNSEITSPPTV